LPAYEEALTNALLLLKLRFPLLLLSLLPFLAAAQETKKSYRGLGLWPDAEVVYQLYPKGFFYFDNQWRYNTDQDGGQISESGVFSNFEDIRVTLGYEQDLGEQWRAGIAQRLSFEEEQRNWYTRVQLRHEGKIGSVAFIKQATYDHIEVKDLNLVENQPPSKAINRVLFTGGLEKPFKIKETQFTGGLEYQVLFLIDPEAKNQDPGPSRVDRTRMTGELTWLPNKTYSLSLYAMRQTHYFKAGATYNEDQTVKEPEHNFNLITPVIGLKLQINTNLDEIYPTRFQPAGY